MPIDELTETTLGALKTLICSVEIMLGRRTRRLGYRNLVTYARFSGKVLTYSSRVAGEMAGQNDVAGSY